MRRGKVLVFVCLLVVVILLISYYTIGEQKYYYAKGFAHYSNRHKLRHYDIHSYDKGTNKLVGIKQVDGFNRLLSYIKYNYNSMGLLITENKYSPKGWLIHTTLYTYNKDNVLIKARKYITRKAIFTKYFTFGYNNNKLLYKRTYVYRGFHKGKNNLSYIKHITYNLSGYPKRVQYFKPIRYRGKEKLKLIWYEDTTYRLGKEDYTIRFDATKRIRSLVRYGYDSIGRLARLIIYEGAAGFLGYKYDYRRKLTLIQRVKFAYPKDRKVRRVVDVIFDDIDIVQDSIDESREKSTKKVDEYIARARVKEVDKGSKSDKRVDKKPKSDKRVDKKSKSDKSIDETLDKKYRDERGWVLNINKVFTAKPYYNRFGLYLGISGNKLISIGDSGKVNWDILVNGEVKVITGYKGLIYIGTSKGFIYGVQAIDGKIVWKKEDSYSYKGFSFYINQSRLISINSANEVIAFTLRDGKVLWRFKPRAPIIYSPIGKLDKVIVFSKDMAMGINANNGVIGQYKKYSSAIISQPVLAGNNIVVFLGYRVIAWDYSNLSILRWSIKGIAVMSLALVHDSSIYVGTDEGKLVKIRLKDGFILWEAFTNKINFYLSIDDKFVYITHNSDDIILLNRNNGIEYDRYVGIDGDSITTPVMTMGNNRIIFYGTSSARLYKDKIE